MGLEGIRWIKPKSEEHWRGETNDRLFMDHTKESVREKALIGFANKRQRAYIRVSTCKDFIKTDLYLKTSFVWNFWYLSINLASYLSIQQHAHLSIYLSIYIYIYIYIHQAVHVYIRRVPGVTLSWIWFLKLWKV